PHRLDRCHHHQGRSLSDQQLGPRRRRHCHRRHRRHRRRCQQRPGLLHHLPPLRLGSPLQRIGPVHVQRSRLQLLIDDKIVSCVRHGRLIHPVPNPTRPAVPPGRVNLFWRQVFGPCCTTVTEGCEPSGATFCTSCYCELL